MKLFEKLSPRGGKDKPSKVPGVAGARILFKAPTRAAYGLPVGVRLVVVVEEASASTDFHQATSDPKNKFLGATWKVGIAEVADKWILKETGYNPLHFHHACYYIAERPGMILKETHKARIDFPFNPLKPGVYRSDLILMQVAMSTSPSEAMVAEELRRAYMAHIFRAEEHRRGRPLTESETASLNARGLMALDFVGQKEPTPPTFQGSRHWEWAIRMDKDLFRLPLEVIVTKGEPLPEQKLPLMGKEPRPSFQLEISRVVGLKQGSQARVLIVHPKLGLVGKTAMFKGGVCKEEFRFYRAFRPDTQLQIRVETKGLAGHVGEGSLNLGNVPLSQNPISLDIAILGKDGQPACTVATKVTGFPELNVQGQ